MGQTRQEKIEEKNYTLRGLKPQDVINKIKNADDGIYIYNHNYWSCKNWTIYVIINHEIHKEDNFQHLNSSNNNGHGGEWYIGAIEHLEDTLKMDYPNLPIYYCDIFWSDFLKSHYELSLDQRKVMVDTFGADGVFDVMDNNEEY